MTQKELRTVKGSYWFNRAKKWVQGAENIDTQNLPPDRAFLASVIEEISGKPGHPLWGQICARYSASIPDGTGELLEALGLSEETLVSQFAKVNRMRVRTPEIEEGLKSVPSGADYSSVPPLYNVCRSRTLRIPARLVNAAVVYSD